MQQDEERAYRAITRGETESPERDYPPAAPTPPKMAQDLLAIAQRIETFVNDNGWSWCVMDRVYRILKAVHG